MTEHAERAPVAGRERPAPSRVAKSIDERGADWPLAALFFACVVALYGTVAAALYLLVTDVIM